MPDMRKVFSSNVVSIGYDEDAAEMFVEYNSGKTYVYSGVPADVFQQVSDSPSIGQAMNGLIKGKYSYGIKS